MQAVSRHGFIRWASVLFVLLIGCVSTAAFLLNHSHVRNLIAEHLKTRLGIEVSTVRIQLVPTISIEATDLLLRDALTSEASLRAATASLSIRLWPFLTKRVLMVTLHATEPVVVIRRDTEGRWHVPFIEASAADDSDDTSRRTWMLTDITLDDGRIRILDANRIESEGIGVHHVQARLKTHLRETDADVMFRGTTEDGADLQIAGALALERLDPSNGMIKRQFDGTVSFHNWDLGYWLKRTRQSTAISSKAAAWRGKISAGLHLDLPANGHGFDGIVSDLTMETGWLTIHGQMTMKDAGTDHPAYDLTLLTTPVSSETLFSHIPNSWIPEQIQALIQKHELAGTIELTSVALRGRLDVLRAPDQWHVVTKLTNGRGRWEDRPVLVRDVSGTVSIAPSRANVLHVSADVNGVHVTSEKLSIVDMDIIPTLEASLIGEGPMENVMALVDAFSEGTEAGRVVRTVSGATGHFRVAAHLAGPLVPKPSLRLLSVEMSVQDMGARLAKALSVVNVNGAIEADSRLLQIKHVAGLFQGMYFQAEGHIGMESPPRVNNLKIEMWSDGRTIQDLLAASLPDTAMHIDGQAHSTVSLSGTSSAVQCRGSIDLTQTGMSIPSVLHKKKGIPAFLEWEGTLFDRERITIDRLQLALPDGELRAVGHVELDRIPKFHVKLDAEFLSLHALAQLGIDIPLTEGIVRASTSINGEGTNWRSWMPTGWARIEQGVVVLPTLTQNVSELSGRLQFTPRGVLLNEVSFRMGDGDLRLTGMIEHWRSNPRATLMVESSELDVSQFFSTKSTHVDSAGSNVQAWMQSKVAAITFVVKQLRYERLLLKTISGTLTVDHRNAQLNDLRGETPNGMLAGRLAARFDEPDQIDLAADLSVDGIPAQVLATTDKREHLLGDLSVDGVIQARIDRHSPWKDTLSTGRDGIVLKVTNGRLQDDPVMTKVLTILNLPAMVSGRVDFDDRGIPFDSLSARLVGQNGVFSSDDILLESPVIKVAGAGSANVKDNGLDLALAVSPMAAYSDLIGKMPLFAPLFAGDHSGLTTALFEAKGSLLDPQVAYLPLRSLATGLSGYPRLAIDVLMNAIKLPTSSLAFATE
jgi:AsmA-like protein